MPTNLNKSPLKNLAISLETVEMFLTSGFKVLSNGLYYTIFDKGDYIITIINEDMIKLSAVCEHEDDGNNLRNTVTMIKVTGLVYLSRDEVRDILRMMILRANR